MSVEDQRDIPIETIAALSRAVIAADFGADAIKGCYEHPRTLFEIDERQLPALVVYCSQQGDRIRDSTSTAQDLIVTFEFAIPSSNLQDERPGRWPALRAVWNSLVSALRAGHHIDVQDDTDVMDAASTYLELDSPRVAFLIADGGRDTAPIDVPRFPFFRGTMTFEHVPDFVDLANLAPFLEFYASFNAPDDQDTGLPILIDLNLALEGYS